MGSRLAWVRDVTYQGDKSLVRAGNAARVVAWLRGLAIGVPGPGGQAGIAAADRGRARGPQRALTLLHAA
jgi:hypothetical protein